MRERKIKRLILLAEKVLSTFLSFRNDPYIGKSSRKECKEIIKEIRNLRRVLFSMKNRIYIGNEGAKRLLDIVA